MNCCVCGKELPGESEITCCSDNACIYALEAATVKIPLHAFHCETPMCKMPAHEEFNGAKLCRFCMDDLAVVHGDH